MPIARPSENEQPQNGPQEEVRRPDERERDHTRTHTRARDDNTATPGEPGGSGEIVPFPGAELVPQGPPAALVAAKAWLSEAGDTAVRAVDGSVYSARPPSFRDSITRLQRAEWSGGIPALRWAGWIYGYPIQILIRAPLLALLWLLDHPSRLIVLGVILGAATAPLYLH